MNPLIIQLESRVLRILLMKCLKQNLILRPVILVIVRYNLEHKLRIESPNKEIKAQDYKDREKTKTKINGLSITKNKYFRKIKSDKQ